MQDGIAAHQVHPDLKTLVTDASRALAHLDATRLEELALSCQALNRDLTPSDRKALSPQVDEAAGDMAVFARILDETRANLRVMNRQREFYVVRLEYGGQQPLKLLRTENIDGFN